MGRSVMALIAAVTLLFIDEGGAKSAKGRSSCCDRLIKCNSRKKYTLYTDTYVNHWEASRICRKRGKLLAMINCEAELKTIESTIKIPPCPPEDKFGRYCTFWTGGTRTTQYGWTWESIRKSIPYFKWDAGEPNDMFGLEKCLHLIVDPKNADNMLMNDTLCYRRMYTLCQDNPCSSDCWY